MLRQTRLDVTDLRIMKLLSRDSRTPYRNIASAVGIMPSAVKERINKMEQYMIGVTEPDIERSNLQETFGIYKINHEEIGILYDEITGLRRLELEKSMSQLIFEQVYLCNKTHT